MRKLLFFIAGLVVVLPSFSVSYTSRGSGNTVATSRSLMASTPFSDTTVSYSGEVEEDDTDQYEAAKELCLANNIGIGNTFVWASRYSNSASYNSLIEDVENPENNTCFVRVEVTSADPGVDLSFVDPAYFEMGQNLTCGDWTDKEKIQEEVLDAKKKGRGWAIAGASVGGAALGVGAMELFGNKAIGGKVMGQKGMEEREKLISQLLTLKNKDATAYNSLISDIKQLNTACNNIPDTYSNKPNACAVDYASLLSELGEK